MPLPTLLLTPLLHHRHGEPAAMAVLQARSPRILVHAHAAPGSTQPKLPHQTQPAAVAALHWLSTVSTVHEQLVSLSGKHLPALPPHHWQLAENVSVVQNFLFHMFRHGQKGGEGFDSCKSTSCVKFFQLLGVAPLKAQSLRRS
jgi:hypothetical protein